MALVESESPFSFEFHAEETYAGEGDVQRGSLSVRDFDESDTKLHFILTHFRKGNKFCCIKLIHLKIVIESRRGGFN